MVRPIKVPSKIGFSEPTANGMTVKGTRPIEMALYSTRFSMFSCQRLVSYFLNMFSMFSMCTSPCVPLHCPVIASMGRVWVWNRRRVVHASSDDLWKRRKDLSCGRGLESRPRDSRGQWCLLARSQAGDDGRGCALHGSGLSLAKERGSQCGGHDCGGGAGGRADGRSSCAGGMSSRMRSAIAGDYARGSSKFPAP